MGNISRKIESKESVVKMQEDREGYPLHYNDGYYRWYKANKIKPDDIVVI